MLEHAIQICDANFGNIYRWDGSVLHLVAAHNTPLAFAEARKRTPHDPTKPNFLISRMLATKAPIQVADAKQQPGYLNRSNSANVMAVELGGIRTVLAVPMFKDDELIGSFTRSSPGSSPISKQVALVTSFATQAVIAIENTRILSELHQRTTDLLKSLERQSRDVLNDGLAGHSAGPVRFVVLSEDCSHVTRPGASPPTWRSCRTC